MPTQEEVEESPLKETDNREKIERYLSFQKYEKERIANEEKKKKLVDFDKTAEIVFNFFRNLRDDLLEVGKRTGPTSMAAWSPPASSAKSRTACAG